MTTIKFSTAVSVTLLAVVAAAVAVGAAAGTIHAETITSADVAVSPITATTSATSATVSWTTTEVATSQIMYGTSTTYADTGTGNLALDHTITVNGLSPATTYHFDVSSDGQNGVVTSPDQTFTTAASSSQQAPVISQILAIPTYSIATIIWTTDQPSNSEVLYGASGNYTASTTGNATLATSTTQHMVSIMNLSPDTTYHFAVVSANTLGLTSTSTDQTFTTTAVPTY